MAATKTTTQILKEFRDIIAEKMAALAAPTPKAETKTRPGRGGSGALTYVDARFVMDRLDSTVGPMAWTDSYRETPGGIECTITIRFDNDSRFGGLYETASKSDVGIASRIEPAKGAYSDAFKRAAVKWGIARDLYDPSSEVYAEEPQAEPKPAPEVVGAGLLTDTQRKRFFAAFKEAGLTDKRKSALFLMTSKHSVKSLTPADLDRVLDLVDYRVGGEGNEDYDTVWENIDMVESDA